GWRRRARPRRSSEEFTLDAEQSAVARLDLLARPLDADGVLLHQLDVAQGPAPGLFLHQRVHRAQRADVDDELLALGREAVALEQPRRVRVGRVLENAVGSDHHRATFGRIDDLDRLSLLLLLQHVVLAAVGLNRALAEQELFRRVGRRLHLHDALFGELFEVLPAELAYDLIGRGQRGAAIARVRLDDLAGPFRVEQVGETLRRLVSLYQVRVVGNRTEGDAET